MIGAFCETPTATEELVTVCVTVCRRGHWIEADPCGVTCPFCGAWENLPEPICPNHECGALLEGVVYQRDLRKLRRYAP